MENLQSYVGRDVTIIDESGKIWAGVVDSYDPDDSFGDYEGESIGLRVNGDPNDLVCFGKTQIVGIRLNTK